MELKEMTTFLPEQSFASMFLGGAKRGAWQAGVVTALTQRGIMNACELFSGTSVGALNAALFAKFGFYVEGAPLQPYMTIVDVWESINANNKVYNGDINSAWDKFLAFMNVVTQKPAVLDPTPLYKLLEKLFQHENLRDVAGSRELIITALDLQAEDEVFFNSFTSEYNRKAYDVLRATSAIQGAFPPIAVTAINSQEDHDFIDGGNAANNPFVSLDIYNESFPSKKLNKVIVFYTNPDKSPVSKDRYKTAMAATIRGVSAGLAAQERIVERYIKQLSNVSDIDVFAMWPYEDLGDPLNFKDCPQLFEKGYQYGCAGMGYSYKQRKGMSIEEFFKK